MTLLSPKSIMAILALVTFLGLEDVDGLDWDRHLAVLALLLDSTGCIHHHVGEEVVVNSCQLSGHGRLGYVDQAVASKLVSAEGKVFRDKLASVLAGQCVSRDDGCGVDLLLDKFVCVLQE